MVPWWTLLLVAFVAYVIGGWRRMRQNVALRTDLRLAVEGARASALAHGGSVVIGLPADVAAAYGAADDGTLDYDDEHVHAILRASRGTRDADRLAGVDPAHRLPRPRGGVGAGGSDVDVWSVPVARPLARPFDVDL